jgi:hypothetical protein
MQVARPRVQITVGETSCHCPTNYPTISFQIAPPLSATLSPLLPTSNMATPGRIGAGASNSVCDGSPKTLDLSLQTLCKNCCKSPDQRASHAASDCFERHPLPQTTSLLDLLISSLLKSARTTHISLRPRMGNRSDQLPRTIDLWTVQPTY